MSIDREHLDAETVAAWIDGGLEDRARAAAEAHASNCDRCQALLATLAQTLPAEEGRDFQAGVTSGARSIWRWWMAPIAAATAAVTIWMVVPQDPMQRPPLPEQQAELSSAPAGPPPPATAPFAPPETSATTPSASASADARVQSRAATGRRDAETKEAVADSQSNKAVADTSARAEKQEAVATLQERVTIAPATPAPAPPAEPARKGAALGAAQASLAKRFAPIEIIAPDAQRRWRVASGIIELSSDGGRTWTAAPGTTGGEVLAGSAPDAQVCWMVGRQGLVLRATEGTNFTPLPFPERVDLVSVTALDARRATVVTADGRIFETVDNGQNWRNP